MTSAPCCGRERDEHVGGMEAWKVNIRSGGCGERVNAAAANARHHYCRKLNWRSWQELQNPSRSAKFFETPYVREARIHFPTTFLEIHFSVT